MYDGSLPDGRSGDIYLLGRGSRYDMCGNHNILALTKFSIHNREIHPNLPVRFKYFGNTQPPLFGNQPQIQASIFVLVYLDQSLSCQS